MREKIKKILGDLLGGGVVCFLIFAVFGVIALVGGNLMALFGFRYDSIGSLLLFFLLGALLGLPLELFSTALPKALYTLGKADRRQANLLYVPLDTLCTMGVFWLVDRWMNSVSATGLSLCIVGLWMAVTTLPIKKED